jgi:hypothetical protein
MALRTSQAISRRLRLPPSGPGMTLNRFAGANRFQERPLKLELRIGFFHIADDRLPTIIHMDVLDADKLVTAIPQASKNLNLRRKCSEQTSRSRSERRNPPLCSKTAFSIFSASRRA